MLKAQTTKTQAASPKGAKRKLTRIEKKEIAALIQKAKGDGKEHTPWEMPVVLAGMYGLRMSEIIGLRTPNIDLEKMQFGVVEQMPFKVPPGTKTITEMAPTK